METKNTSIALRCDQSVKTFLEKVGEQERRSMSQVALIFLEQGIKDYVKSHPDFLPLLPSYLSD